MSQRLSTMIPRVVLCLAVGMASWPCHSAATTSDLHGGVTENVISGNGLSDHINKLLDEAYQNDEAGQEIEKLVKKYSTRKHKVAVAASEFAYTLVPYRGFGPSKLGANIVLEKSKIKSLAGAEFLKQHRMDELHTSLATDLLQISEALDCQDKDRSHRLLSDATDKLTKLVGEQKTKETLSMMSDWSQGLHLPETAFAQQRWDVGTLEHNVRQATSMAVSADPVFEIVKKKVEKYNRKKTMTAVGSLVESGCAIGSFLSPGLLIPLAVECANASFVTGTGGSEETKMVNEMYYAKRMESRWMRLNAESQLALTSYQMALQNKQPTLLACSETILQDLVGPSKSKTLLGQSVLTQKTVAKDVTASGLNASERGL